ncbi:hypothetical protein N9L18_01130, partial [Candidatus Pacebacteria bacterium]|nr:hypothetical protein [Candidatus Paceibacterota bacterium]
MLNKQLRALIETSLSAGRTLEDVRAILKKQGFLDSAITELFTEYQQGEKAPYVSDDVPVVPPEISSAEKMEEAINKNSPILKTEKAVPEGFQGMPKDPNANKESAGGETLEKEAPVRRSILSPKHSSKPINVGLGGVPELRN